MTCVMSDFSHLGLYSIFKFLDEKIFQKNSKISKFWQKNSKILLVNFFCKNWKNCLIILSIVLNFHVNWIRIEDFLLIETFLWEAACLVATRQTRIVTRNNFAPTSTYICHYFCILHKLAQTKNGAKWKSTPFATKNL